MRADLPAIVQANGTKRDIRLQPIKPTATLSGELNRILVKPVTIWREQSKAIIAEYDATISETDTSNVSSVQHRIEHAAILAASIITAARISISHYAFRVETWQRARWINTVRAATTLDISHIVQSAQVIGELQTSVARNVALIKDISDQTQSRVSDAVFRGIQQRTPTAEVAREIAKIMKVSDKRANLIAKDQLAKLLSTLQRVRMQQMGIDQYIWQHSGKVHFRPVHKIRNGLIYTLGDPKGDEPGMAPYCGCSRIPLIPKK